MSTELQRAKLIFIILYVEEKGLTVSKFHECLIIRSIFDNKKTPSLNEGKKVLIIGAFETICMVTLTIFK